MIFPNNLISSIDGLKEIEYGLNSGIEFAREPDYELQRIYKEKAEIKARLEAFLKSRRN